MQPRSRTVKEGQTDQEREGKVLVSEGEGEQRRKGGIDLVKGNIWSTEVFFLLKEKLLWAGRMEPHTSKGGTLGNCRTI